MRSNLFCLALSLLPLAAMPASAQNDVEGVVTVQVTGQGETRSEARLDAIRQATQYATKQLVIAERLIENDDIILDRIYSTMNGFVEGFEVLSEAQTDGTHELLAEVSISKTRINSFISVDENSDNLDASTILAETRRRTEQSSIRKSMLISYFRFFPEAMVDTEVKIVDFDQRTIRFTANVSWNTDFISSTTNLIRELAAFTCKIESRSRFHEVISHWDKPIGGTAGDEVGVDQMDQATSVPPFERLPVFRPFDDVYHCANESGQPFITSSYGSVEHDHYMSLIYPQDKDFLTSYQQSTDGGYTIEINLFEPVSLYDVFPKSLGCEMKMYLDVTASPSRTRTISYELPVDVIFLDAPWGELPVMFFNNASLSARFPLDAIDEADEELNSTISYRCADNSLSLDGFEAFLPEN